MRGCNVADRTLVTASLRAFVGIEDDVLDTAQAAAPAVRIDADGDDADDRDDPSTAAEPRASGVDLQVGPIARDGCSNKAFTLPSIVDLIAQPRDQALRDGAHPMALPRSTTDVSKCSSVSTAGSKITFAIGQRSIRLSGARSTRLVELRNLVLRQNGGRLFIRRRRSRHGVGNGIKKHGVLRSHAACR